MGGTDKIRVGVVGRAHGIHGAIRVFLDEPGSDSLLRVKEVFLGESEVPYRLLNVTRCGRFMALELEGITDRDHAFERTGEVVRISRQSLRPLKHAYYACDLAGLSLCDETGRNWGVVEEVVAGSAHDLLKYRREGGGSGLVPFVSAHVGEVNLEQKVIKVDSVWMSELDAIYGA